ncbi:MAG: hypothetical protein AAF840_14345, partial [Bacteroidota bacterium]
MSDFFLRSKHWMLFLLIALPTLLSYVFQYYYMEQIQSFTQEMEATGGEMDFTFPDLREYAGYLYGYLAILLISGLTQIGWLWTIGNDLHNRVPEGFKMKLSTFRVTTLISTLFLFGVAIGMYLLFDFLADFLPDLINNQERPSSGELDDIFGNVLMYFGLFFLLGLVAFGCQVYNVVFVGKTLKSIELGKPASGGDAAGYAILAYLLIIGIWIL